MPSNPNTFPEPDESSSAERIRDEMDDEALARDLENLGMDPATSLDGDFETDSMENVLERFNLIEDTQTEAEVEAYERPLLVERMAMEVSEWLEKLKVKGGHLLESEKFLELCERTGITPDPRNATAVFTDLVIMMEEEDYKERSMTSPPTLSDIEEASESIDDFEEIQRWRTAEAHTFLSKFIRDPLLKLPSLIERKKLLQQHKPKSMEEFDDMQEEIVSINMAIDRFAGIDEVKVRCERAFRSMHWLLQQDYLSDFASELKSSKKKNEPVDFDCVAGALSGRKDPVEERYYPGIISELLVEHRELMSTGDKTSRQNVREASKLRRLEQAQAICEYVFAQDIEDRIYRGSPISVREFEKLEFIRKSIYDQGNTTILDQFIEFLPGSSLQTSESGEVYKINYPRKFSGRSLMDLFNEINTIIVEHPSLDIDRITSLVEAKIAGNATSEHQAELAVSALKVLEKLVYKENHSTSGLVGA